GVEMFEISRQLGHSNIGTTSDIYSELFERRRRPRPRPWTARCPGSRADSHVPAARSLTATSVMPPAMEHQWHGDQDRVREVVARVVKEAVDRTNPRSARKVADLLFEFGYGSSKNPGEPFSEGAVRAWMNQRDRPLAEVIIALTLYHRLSLDEYLSAAGLRTEVAGLHAKVAGLEAEVERLRARAERHDEAFRLIASSAQIEQRRA